MIPRTHRHLANRAFAVAAPSCWNSLPDNVRDSQSYSIFYPNLKLTILTLHYITIIICWLYYLTYILLRTAPLSYGWGRIPNPDDDDNDDDVGLLVLILSAAAAAAVPLSIKAKIHYTSFPVASPQQVGNFPVFTGKRV